MWPFDRKRKKLEKEKLEQQQKAMSNPHQNQMQPSQFQSKAGYVEPHPHGRVRRYLTYPVLEKQEKGKVEMRPL